VGNETLPAGRRPRYRDAILLPADHGNTIRTQPLLGVVVVVLVIEAVAP
jgi:hypothetical protein